LPWYIPERPKKFHPACLVNVVCDLPVSEREVLQGRAYEALGLPAPGPSCPSSPHRELIPASYPEGGLGQLQPSATHFNLTGESQSTGEPACCFLCCWWSLGCRFSLCTGSSLVFVIKLSESAPWLQEIRTRADHGLNPFPVPKWVRGHARMVIDCIAEMVARANFTKLQRKCPSLRREGCSLQGRGRQGDWHRRPGLPDSSSLYLCISFSAATAEALWLRHRCVCSQRLRSDSRSGRQLPAKRRCVPTECAHNGRTVELEGNCDILECDETYATGR
jgi:hypothetical protein